MLVTGGAGFIGSHVCEALLKRNDSVICVDNFDPYYDVKIKEDNIKTFLGNSNFKLYREDILNFEKLKEIFKNNKIEKIAHIAAKAGVRPSIKDPVGFERVNILGTINLLELAKEFKIKNFVFGSSSSVYGNNKKIPFSETDNVDNPISPYAATKKSAELWCSYYHNLYKIPITCLRFFTCYGLRGRPDMAPYKFTKLINEGKELPMYGDGTTKRDYTYITDILDGVLVALDKNFDFEIINLGNSKTTELKKFIELIEDLLGKKAIIKQLPMQPGDVIMTYADITKAKKLLNYEPKVNVKEGIKKFIEWFKKKC